MILSEKSILKWSAMPSGLIVPADCKPKPRPKAFDFFAGCGGFSCGLVKGGFHVVGALEMDFAAAQTYMVNLGSHPMKIHFDTDERAKDFQKYLQKQFDKLAAKKKILPILHKAENRDCAETFDVSGSGWISTQKGVPGCNHFFISDICNINGKIILDRLGMERGELDLVVGSPPCQGFSTANPNRDETDERNVLAFEYARLITELNPKAIALEEVPEFVNFETPEGINILDGFCKILADGDYAPFESLRRSVFGRKGAKAILRSEKKQKQKKKIENRTENARLQPKQASLFI